MKRTAEEMKISELAAATGASSKDCRAALEANGFDVRRSERAINEKHLDRVCSSGAARTTGDGFAKRMMNKPLGQVSDLGLQFLRLAAQAMPEQESGSDFFLPNLESK